MITDKKTICLVGGSSQTHILAGFLGHQSNIKINILTRKPHLWFKDFETKDLKGNIYKAKLNKISNDPRDVIIESDIIIIGLPGFAIKKELLRLKPYLKQDQIIGTVFSGTGFFFHVIEILGKETPCFGFQRVPFTGRVLDYGKRGILKGYKDYLAFAELNIKENEEFRFFLESLFRTKTIRLDNILEATLSNSNPILHPVRLYVLFKDWTPDKTYTEIPFVYDTWDDESSELWIACDLELQEITKKLRPINVKVTPVLDYYNCKNVKELTGKIKSIKPFRGVRPHMIETAMGFQLDVKHRYFSEDIPFGLILIKSIAERVKVCTPNIDLIINWAQKVMNKEFLVNNHLKGKDINETLNLDDKIFSKTMEIIASQQVRFV